MPDFHNLGAEEPNPSEIWGHYRVGHSLEDLDSPQKVVVRLGTAQMVDGSSSKAKDRLNKASPEMARSEVAATMVASESQEVPGAAARSI